MIPTPQERALWRVPVRENRAVLHTDAALMPPQAAFGPAGIMWGQSEGLHCRPYWMNKLQRINSREQLFATLNPPAMPRRAFSETSYDHHCSTLRRSERKEQIWSLQGVNKTWFCGSLWRWFPQTALQAGARCRGTISGVRRPWSSPKRIGRIHAAFRDAMSGMNAIYTGHVAHNRPGNKPSVRCSVLCWRSISISRSALDDAPKAHNRASLFIVLRATTPIGSTRRCVRRSKKTSAPAGIGWTGGRIVLLHDAALSQLRVQSAQCLFLLPQMDRTAALVHEISNTFGEQHFTLLPAAASGNGVVRQDRATKFFVSPFLGPTCATSSASRLQTSANLS